jgi:glycosyltransferase involved in cell wall biosynthesis
MKKILIISYSLGTGGSELNAYKIISMLKDSNFDWLYLNDDTLEIKEMLERKKNIGLIKNIKFPGIRALSIFLWLRKIAKLVKFSDYTSIYAIGFLPSVIMSLLKIFFSIKINLITTRRELMPWRKLYHAPFVELINICSNKIETNSRNIETMLLSNFITKNKVYYLPNILFLHTYGANVDLYSMQNKRNIGIVANVRSAKNFPLFLEIAKDVLKKNDDVIFSIAGKDQNSLVRKFIKENQLEEKLFIFEDIKYNNIISFYRSLDLFLFTSKHEGSPNAIYEAISCGLPIVSSSIPATKELLKNGINGFLCDLNDKSSFVDSINLLLSDNELYKEIKENNIEKYKNEFDNEIVRFILNKNFN